jgi:uncharacterized membrane protein YheB (UPF0754 family)
MNSEILTLLGMFLMPLTYGFIGWVTNWLALKMTFYPLEFKGIKPFFGWQGIVPRKAQKLALKSINIMTEKLIKVEDFFSRVKPDEMEKEFQPIITETLPLFLSEFLQGNQTLEQDKILDIVSQRTKHVIQTISSQIQSNPKEVFNFRALVLKKITGPNVEKIVNIFQEVGDKEFLFIERSGFYFGFLLGAIQSVIWWFFPLWWSLPLQGIFVGYITNYLAITMIFRPLYEKKIIFFRYRGLFLKRQEEVSQKYSNMFATQILTGSNILEEVLYKRVARKILESMEEAVKEQDQTIYSSEEHKKFIIKHIIEVLHTKGSKLEAYMTRSMSVEKNMFSKMKVLSPEEFEPILRSAFQEDEYILVLIGSILGGFVGVIQAIYMMIVK